MTGWTWRWHLMRTAFHIGQGNGDPVAARRRLGAGRLLGLSVETVAQCEVAPSCVDYIGAGPVRATATKPDHAPPIGFDGLARIVAKARFPAFAIGGIKPGDARAVARAGAAGMAVISAIVRAQNAEGATRALVREWGQA